MTQFHTSPPRRIRWLSRLIILFSGLDVQFGWLFKSIGILLFTIIITDQGMRYIDVFSFKWKIDKAHIERVKIEDEEQVNFDMVDVYKFEYKGITYQKNYEVIDYHGSHVDNTVYLKYDRNNPEEAMVYFETPSQIFIWLSLLSLVFFFVVGISISALRYQENINILHLLEKGHFTRGQMVKKKRENISWVYGEGKPFFKYQFNFEEEGKMYQASCITNDIDAVEDEPFERILFDRYFPEKNVVFDAIYTNPIITTTGEVDSSMSFMYLFIPFLIIVQYVFCLIFILGLL